jgi:aerobic carbon-monoxide dehydrogenase medium subunit
MRDFHFHLPSSSDETFALLEEYGEDARVMAGGTALVVLMKQSLLEAEHVISLQHLPGMDSIHLEDDGLHIGALTRHRDVEISPLVRQHAPLLADVYHRVATVKVRNAATVGGGLAHADPSQDPPAGLIALGASVRLQSKAGDRIVPVDELSTDYYETQIRPDELLTEVIVPKQPEQARAVYLKYLPRTEDDYATVAVCALAEMDNGRCRRARVALIAAGPTPVHARAVEQAIEGQTVSPESVRRAAEAVEALVDPLDDFRGSSSYKRDMAVVFTRRALERALELA